jgi:hypothetical protein
MTTSGSTTVTYVDPTGEESREDEVYDLALTVDGPVIGLLANGLKDSDNFLDEVGKALAALDRTMTFRHYVKPDLAPLPDSLLEEILGECDAVVAAYGH